MECSNDFAPIGDAFTALGRITNDGTPLENEDIKPSLSESLGSRTSCGTCTHDNDLTMHDILDSQVLTSCVSIFDDVGDHHHHVFGLTVGEPFKFCLSTLKMRFHQDFGVFHAAGPLKQGHQFIEVIIAEGLDEF